MKENPITNRQIVLTEHARQRYQERIGAATIGEMVTKVYQSRIVGRRLYKKITKFSRYADEPHVVYTVTHDRVVFVTAIGGSRARVLTCWVMN